MLAHIYRPAKTATQSGQACSTMWILEYAPESRSELDPLMGWTSSDDMRSQVRLTFATQEEAIRYARSHGIPFQVKPPQSHRYHIRKAGYGGNFAYTRREGWTH